MTSLLLKQDTIDLDIEPTAFKVGSPSVFGGKVGNLTLEHRVREIATQLASTQEYLPPDQFQAAMQWHRSSFD